MSGTSKAQKALEAWDPDGCPVEVWKAVVETQRHFNDIALKLRGLAVTLSGAFIGLYAALLKDAAGTSMPKFAAFGAAVVLVAFYVMDVKWYQEFLRGAGKVALHIEEKCTKLPPLSLNISEASHQKLWFVSFRSKRRLNAFYALLIGPIVVLGVIAPGEEGASTQGDVRFEGVVTVPCK